MSRPVPASRPPDTPATLHEEQEHTQRHTPEEKRYHVSGNRKQ